MFRSPLLHPVLFSLYPVLFLFAQNIDITEVKYIALPTVISIGVFGGMWLFLNRIVRNQHKCALMISVFILCFATYGHVHSVIDAFVLEMELTTTISMDDVLGLRQDVHRVLSLFYLILLVYGVSRILRLQGEASALTEAVNVMACVLLFFPLLTIADYLLDSDDVEPSRLVRQVDGSVEIASAPDIYYIILDGYGRSDVLKQHFAFDNAEFLNFLDERNFFVASKSHSNYYWTYLSLSSSLNMEYINYLADEAGETKLDRTRAYQMIRKNQVTGFLKQRGYTYIHFSSSWGPTMSNPFADRQIDCSQGHFQVEFYRVWIESTWLKFWDRYVGVDLAQCYLTSFRALADVAADPGPKFVFSHFVLPHHPYLFDRDGNILKNATISNQFDFQAKLWGKKDKYIDQLVFVNKQIQQIVESILSRSAQPPIIVIQSDHGPTLLDENATMARRARLANFLAVYAPGQDELFPPDLMPVNVFRRIFNAYFDADMEILPAQHYYSAFDKPYQFVPIPLEQLN